MFEGAFHQPAGAQVRREEADDRIDPGPRNVLVVMDNAVDHRHSEDIVGVGREVARRGADQAVEQRGAVGLVVVFEIVGMQRPVHESQVRPESVVGRGAGGIVLDFVVVAGLLGIQASLDADIARLDIEHRGGLSVFTHEGGCRRFVVAPLVTERAIGGGKHGERVFRDGFDQCDRVVQPLDMSRKGIAEACRAASGQQCRGSQQEQCLFHGGAVRRPGVIPIRRSRAGRR